MCNTAIEQGQPDANAALLAHYLTGVMQGASVMARSGVDRDRIEAYFSQALSTLH